MGTWRHRIVNRSNVNFWPLLESINIANGQPCDLATFSGQIVDQAGSIVLANEDEITSEFAEDDVNFVKVFAGDVTKCVLTDIGRSEPRVYEFTAQDYTARLEDTIIDIGDRVAEESATARVNWIMSFAPSRGITTTNVASISRTMDAFDYTGMTRREALSQVAAYCGAVFYVDFDKDLHFFLTETNPAPFDLDQANANPPTSYAFWDFALENDSSELANAIFVKGENDSLWREDSGSIATWGRQERAIVDENLWKTAQLERFGDRALELYAQPMQSGSLTLTQPGLEAGQLVHITSQEWSIDADFYVTQMDIECLDPNGPSGGKALYHISFADRILCKGTPQSRARELVDDINDPGDGGNPGNPPEGDGNPGGDGGGPVDAPCNCTPDNFDGCPPLEDWASAADWTQFVGGSFMNDNWTVQGSTLHVVMDESDQPTALYWGVEKSLSGDELAQTQVPFEVSCQVAQTNPISIPGVGGGGNIGSMRAFFCVMFGSNERGIGVRNDIGGTARVYTYANGVESVVSTLPFLPTGYTLGMRFEAGYAEFKYNGGIVSSGSNAVYDLTTARKLRLRAGISADNAENWALFYDFGVIGLDGDACTPSAGQSVEGEQIGFGDGSTDTFTTDAPFQSGSLTVYVDGIDVSGSIIDTQATTGSFTLDFAPESDELITVKYQAAVGEITAEAVGTGNDFQTVWYTDNAYVAGSLTVYVDGVATAVSETSPGTGKFAFTTAPASGDVITADYTGQ